MVLVKLKYDLEFISTNGFRVQYLNDKKVSILRLFQFYVRIGY